MKKLIDLARSHREALSYLFFGALTTLVNIAAYNLLDRAGLPTLQTLYLDGADAEYMKGKRVVIVDDVISTGESLRAMEELVHRAGGNIVGRMAILAEGDATERDDLIYLEKLPLFNKDGDPIA